VKKLFRIPLLFFFLASSMGVLLRYMLVYPVERLTFSYLLHGHSHVMFLGWVFNLLFLGFVIEFIDEERSSVFKKLFWIFQVLVVGMAISFPLQGYGLYSIILSTLHTVIALLYIILFFKYAKKGSGLALWLAKVSLVLFVFSSFGPFYLGYLKASGDQPSDHYQLAIYFYLHFQYNGFFFFGILALFIKIIENSVSPEQLHQLSIGCILFVVAVVPAYILSTLWTKPGLTFNLLGFAAGLLQIAGLVIFCRPLRGIIKTDQLRGMRLKHILSIVFVALVLKFILQVLSAHPGIAIFAYDFRPLVIAYLHLVLVSVVTLFLIFWLIQKNILVTRFAAAGINLLLTGFIGSEFILIMTPWNQHFGFLRHSNSILVLFSILMAIGVGIVGFSSTRQARPFTEVP
jgi:hypothetical protein